MKSRASERCALAALIALVIYCLACFYPAGWSPDSKKVVFPVFYKEGVEKLVITDLDGKAVREVAHVAPEKKRLSPAAWSPDGKWIAYMKFVPEKADGDDEKSFACSLMLQDAESGKEKSIFTMTCDFKESAAAVYGPQWLTDSKALAFHKPGKDASSVVMVDLDGKVTKELPLPEGKLSAKTASISPNGAYVAYAKEVKDEKDKTGAIFVLDVKTGESKEVAAVPGIKEKDTDPRPAWSADSRVLYVVSNDEEKKLSTVQRVDVGTREAKTIWQKEELEIAGLSASAESSMIAIDYSRDKTVGIDVVDTANASAVTVHLSTALHYSTAISPDGKWVAFCPVADKDRKDGSPQLGVIVSSDGRRLSVFVPDPEHQAFVPEFMKARGEAALKVAGLDDELKKADVDLKTVETREQVKKVHAVIEKLVERNKAPIFREAADWAKVQLELTLLERMPQAERAGHAGDARGEIEAFVKAHPGHPFGAEFTKKLDALLKPEPDKEPGPEPEEKPDAA